MSDNEATDESDEAEESEDTEDMLPCQNRSAAAQPARVLFPPDVICGKRPEVFRHRRLTGVIESNSLHALS